MGRTDWWTEGRTVDRGRVYGQTDGETNNQTDTLTDGRPFRCGGEAKCCATLTTFLVVESDCKESFFFILYLVSFYFLLALFIFFWLLTLSYRFLVAGAVLACWCSFTSAVLACWCPVAGAVLTCWCSFAGAALSWWRSTRLPVQGSVAGARLGCR